MFTEFSVFGRRIEHENLWCHICKVQLVQRKYEEEENQEKYCWFCNCVLERLQDEQQDDPTSFEIYRSPYMLEPLAGLLRPSPLFENILSIMYFHLEGIDEFEEAGNATNEQINSLKQETISDESNHSTCYICQDDLKKGEIKMEMQCKHSFHSDCLTTWLKINNSCPVCRAKIN